MKKTAFILISLFACLVTWAQENLLQQAWQKAQQETITGGLLNDPFTEWDTKEFWLSIPQNLRNGYISEAGKLLETDYPALPVSVFLDFVRNGNRSRYQDLQRKRRDMLQVFVLAECMERQGRFLDKIADGVWAICEESYWGLPAHLSLQKKGFGLPDVNEPTVDLFAGETVALMAVTHRLLGRDLASISPLLPQRIEDEANKRVFIPNLTRNDFWWMSFDASLNNGTINNWNPWVNSNWLLAVLLLEKDEQRKKQAVDKIIRSVDLFINHYPEDGGCDEGPAYWGRAGGSLFDVLEYLYRTTHGKLTIFNEQKIKNIGSYIYKAHIHDRYFVNFADAASKTNINTAVVYIFGSRIHNDTMMAMAAEAFRQQQFLEKPAPANGIIRNLLCFGQLGALQSFEMPFVKSPYYYLPGLQVLMARSKSNDGKKEIFVAAQGGHNAESHNHNDVGNFIVYANGEPVLIDVGVETYTAKTFGPERYSIWTMQSQYHNVPTINGFQQQNGRTFAAKNVSANQLPNGGSFMLDISGAYPAEAGVKEWKRKIVLDNPDKLVWTDQYSLEAVKGPVQFHFMTQAEPVITPKGVSIQSGTHSMILGYDLKKLEASVEKIEITDGQLKANWGQVLYRISLRVKTPATAGRYSFTLSGQPD